MEAYAFYKENGKKLWTEVTKEDIHKVILSVQDVENKLLSIFYIMKLYHDLKFNHTYIFSHFLIRDGN